MKEELKSLTWKYFWRQKITEILLFLIITPAVIFIPYLLGHNIGDNMSSWCRNNLYGDEVPCNIYFQWFEGLGYIVLIAGTLFVLAFFGYLWISSNWERAKKRARQDLNNKTIKKK
jgi:hypothetical protein